MASSLNIGVIGAGRIGRLHAAHLAHRIRTANLLMIADLVEEAARQLAHQLHVGQAVQDYRRILDNPAIEAILICSATNTHAQIIEEAAAAGKHIFCEKPIDHSLAKIDRALTVVEQAGVKLQIGFNRRFDANYARVRRAIVEGEIGQPHLIHIISRDRLRHPWNISKCPAAYFST